MNRVLAWKMNRVLAWKVTVAFLVFMIPIIIAAIIIILSLIATNQTISYLSAVTLREMQIFRNFDANYQRLIAEVGVFALYGKEDEAEEGAELIEALEQAITQAEALHASTHDESSPVLQRHLDRTQHEALDAQRADQLGQLVALAQEVFQREREFTPSEIETLLETLEEYEAANMALQDEAARLGQIDSDTVLGVLNEQLRAVLLTFGGMLVLLLALIGLALWFVQRTLVGPINQLARVAEAVTSGQLDQQVAVTSTDEVGVLQRNFNAMIASLRTQYHTLEQQKAMLLAEQNALKQALHELELSMQERTSLQQQVIQAQRDALRELSSPLIPIADGVIVMPLIGAIDTSRAAQILENLLRGVEQYRAKVAIIDITGVQTVDTSVAQVLLQAAQAITLLGAQTMLTGVKPQIAQTVVQLGIDLKKIQTFSTLQQAFLAAIESQLRNNVSEQNRPHFANGLRQLALD